MKRALAGMVMAGVALVLPVMSHAETGDWLVRARVVNIDPDAGSSAGGPLGLPADALDVDNRVAPEVDISYFITKNIALELILTYPQKHDVTLMGADIGSVKHLPPTLTLQYHFMPDRAFKPYVGAGFNYTRFTDRDLLNGTLEVEKDSFGGALQVGFDYALTGNWYLNADVKYLWIDTDVRLKATGATVTKLDIDPWVYGVGIGYRF